MGILCRTSVSGRIGLAILAGAALLIAALPASAGASSGASAQVTYTRELSWTAGVPPGGSDGIIPLTSGPPVASDPSLPDTQILLSEAGYNRFDPATGEVDGGIPWPAAMRVSVLGVAAFSGMGPMDPTNPTFSTVGFRNGLWQYNFVTSQFVGPLAGVSVPIDQTYSLAANADNLTVIADGTTSGIGYSIDPATGAVTPVFATSGDGSDPGQFKAAYYMSYAPDGLLYVLDYGNDRVQRLDPNDGFAPAGQFTLENGVTTANQQFAVGANGNVYLGDGLGGGSAYGPDGTFLGSFTLPDGVSSDPFTGRPYLSADRNGDVFVFDSTGFHEYRDPTVDKASPTLTSVASAGVELGGTLHDTATLSAGDSPEGSLVFRLYGPGDQSCSSSPAFTSSAVTVSGTGDYASPGFAPVAGGTYRWIASYSGDATNNAVAGSCSDAAAGAVVSMPAGPAGVDPPGDQRCEPLRRRLQHDKKGLRTARSKHARTSAKRRIQRTRNRLRALTC